MARKKTAAAKKNQAKKLHLSANRKYKDTVFRMLFADKSNLLSLYNAMSGSDYHDPSKLQIITLENAIYIGMKNDLAFVIGTNLFYTNISQPIIQICRFATCSIFPVNTRKW